MKKEIYTNIREVDALESFFECITSFSIISWGVDFTTGCYTKYLEPNNVSYPLKFYKPIKETLTTCIKKGERNPLEIHAISRSEPNARLAF